MELKNATYLAFNLKLLWKIPGAARMPIKSTLRQTRKIELKLVIVIYEQQPYLYGQLRHNVEMLYEHLAL